MRAIADISHASAWVLVLTACACSDRPRAGQPDRPATPGARESGLVRSPGDAGSSSGDASSEPSWRSLREAKRGLAPHAPWSPAKSLLEQRLGPPDRVEPGLVGWYRRRAAECHVLEVAHDETGDRIDSVVYGAFEEGSQRWQRCQANSQASR